jgi:hypothetical protein
MHGLNASGARGDYRRVARLIAELEYPSVA